MKFANSSYVSFGDYSVTDLINPPRVVILNKRHKHEVIPPASSVIAAVMGTGIHNEIERLLKMAQVTDPRYMLERSVMDVFEVNDEERRLITGRFDILYDMKKMTDIKTAKTWKKVFDPGMIDWHNQQNLYAYLLHRRGVDVESINILCFYKDWMQGNALRDRNYPQSQVCEYNLTLWPFEDTGMYLMNQLARLVDCEHLADDELPSCTRDERWERFPQGVTVQYAIMKNAKAKRANKVCTSMDDAVAYARSSKGLSAESFIEVRYAARKRCETYCAINGFCNDYKAYEALKLNGNLNDKVMIGEVL